MFRATLLIYKLCFKFLLHLNGSGSSKLHPLLAWHCACSDCRGRRRSADMRKDGNALR